MALEKWGAPVYVRHEIVHNRYVVDGLRDKGAVFVEELDECPPDRPVIFSAHGVPKSVPAEAGRREMVYRRRHLPAGHQGPYRGRAPPRERPPDGDDRPCRPPRDDRHHGPAARGRGAAGRDAGRRRLARRARPRAAGLHHPDDAQLDDTAEIVAALRARFPAIVGPHKEDICYATTNRQEAVKAMAPQIDAMLVIGAPNSSNSRRLVEVGRARRLPLCAAGAARRRHRLARAGGRPRGRASPPGPRPPRCWSTR